MKFDVAEGLSGAFDGQLVFGRAIGVVERGLRGAPLGDAPQVFDGVGGVEPPLGRVQLGPLELHERGEIAHFGYSSANGLPSFEFHNVQP